MDIYIGVIQYWNNFDNQIILNVKKVEMKSDNNITTSNNSSTDSLMTMDESSIIVDDNQTIRAPMEDCTGLEVALQVK